MIHFGDQNLGPEKLGSGNPPLVLPGFFQQGGGLLSGDPLIITFCVFFQKNVNLIQFGVLFYF